MTPVLRHSFHRHILAILVTSLLLVVGLGGWATTSEFAGAVVAPGRIVVDSHVKKIQHPSGGIVAQLLVHDGSHVKAGDIVMRLDDTQTRANLAIVTNALDELAARKAREEAERDDENLIDFPQTLLRRIDDTDVAKAVNGERKQFDIRRSAREGLKKQLTERIAQLKQEIVGDTAQIASKNKQIEWINKELEGVNDLWNQRLVPYARVTALERNKDQLLGEHGQLVAMIAQVNERISETGLQILQIDQDMRSEVSKDLGDIRGKMAELVEKKLAAEDQLKRLDIRAPQDGAVQELAVHTIGGVVGPGEVLMLIVPEADALDVEARIKPEDRDQVSIGQRVILRFTAFNQRSTPELNGIVNRISADVIEDQKTRASFYSIRIGLSKGERARFQGRRLVPGMPVESFVQTAPRTVITYLVRPLHDQIARAFREK